MTSTIHLANRPYNLPAQMTRKEKQMVTMPDRCKDETGGQCRKKPCRHYRESKSHIYFDLTQCPSESDARFEFFVKIDEIFTYIEEVAAHNEAIEAKDETIVRKLAEAPKRSVGTRHNTNG